MTANLSRRKFLHAAGLSGAFLPLLEAGHASAAPFPKRLVIFCWSDGMQRQDFWPVLGPSGAETDWVLPTTGVVPGPKLQAYNAPVLEPLVKDFRSKMLVLAGLDPYAFFEASNPSWNNPPRQGDAHNDMHTLLTGAWPVDSNTDAHTAGGPSIDQHIGRALGTRHNLAFPSLVIGGRTGGGFQGTISYAARGTTGITPETNPANLYKTLFAGRALPGATFDKVAATRKSILDYLGKDLTRFGQRMAADDKRKIDAHLQTIRDLEQQLTAAPVAGCSAPTSPMTDFRPNDMYPALLKAQSDLLFAALKCDLTRVATFNFENTGGNDIVFSWLGAEFTGKGDDYPTRQHHDIAHASYRGGEYARRHSRVNQWFYEQVAYFVRQLEATPEGSGTMLDNTAVVVLNSMGVNHWACGLPWVVIGGCGGAIKTGGRLVRFGEYATGKKTTFYWGNGDGDGFDSGHPFTVKGVPHNGFLVALANAMDVPTESFGEARYPGELSGIRT